MSASKTGSGIAGVAFEALKSVAMILAAIQLSGTWLSVVLWVLVGIWALAILLLAGIGASGGKR